MATFPMLKHSSCMNATDLSAKAVSNRKLKSIKITEDSSKVKVTTRSKKSHAVTHRFSLRKRKPTKSCKDSSEKSVKIKNIKKSAGDKGQEEKKTRKKGRNVVINNNINENNHKISIKERKITNHSRQQNQMSLEESFKYQSLPKRLRPRRNKVNYCEDSKLLQKHLPSHQQDSVVILEKIDSDNTRKVPIYKIIKTSELSSENKSDIYNFQFDNDDTKEKPAKKKRKRNIKTKNKIIKKSVRKKVTVGTKTVNNKIDKFSNPDSDSSVKIGQCKSLHEPATEAPPPLEAPFHKSTKEDILKTIETSEVNANVQIIEESSLLDKSFDKPSTQIKKENANKLRVISIENANNITITKAAPGSSKDILPFRSSSDIFNNRSTVQCKNALNMSLIKSLSPISKEYVTPDLGSPWRLPQLPYVFSCAKHFVQSTPNVPKIDSVHKKSIMPIKESTHNTDKVTNLSDMTSKNTNSLIQNISDHKVSYKKNSSSCRKFGTEITNLNNGSIIQNSNVEVGSEKLETETEAHSVTNIQLDTIASTSPNHPLQMYDKENVAANFQTPKKLVKRKLRKRHLSNSPSKRYEIKSTTQNENVDPQPGPSGIRISKNCDEQKVLRQSNLNNFLNLMDIPKNTKISTKHGIFDDAHSSLVSSSAIKKPTTKELKNAFGFYEKDTEFDTSPVRSKLVVNQASNKIQTTCASKPIASSAPARLSLGELKNHLLQKKPDKNADNQQVTKQKNVEVSKPLEVEKNNKSFVNVVNFSDTFDMLSESERLSTCETNVPLFMDLEPSHFSEVLIIFCYIYIYTHIQYLCIVLIYCIFHYLIYLCLYCYTATSAFIQEETCYNIRFLG